MTCTTCGRPKPFLRMLGGICQQCRNLANLKAQLAARPEPPRMLIPWDEWTRDLRESRGGPRKRHGHDAA